MYAAGVPIISDLIPFLGCFDLLGQVKSMKRIARELDSVAGSWVEEHSMRRLKGSEPIDKLDFIDVMLSEIEDDAFGHTRETIIKATAMASYSHLLHYLINQPCFYFVFWFQLAQLVNFFTLSNKRYRLNPFYT